MDRGDIYLGPLVRAGRFDRHITEERPDLEAHLAILRLHASTRNLADPATELPLVAKRTPGFSGADLANVVRIRLCSFLCDRRLTPRRREDRANSPRS